MDEEAIKQRRRDKILARINEPKAPEQNTVESGEPLEKTNVFNRFATLKRKIIQKQLFLCARFSGSAVAGVQLLLYSSGWVYLSVLALFSMLLFCNERSERNEAGDSLDRLLQAYVPVLGGLGSVKKVLKGVQMFVAVTASTILFGVVLAYLANGTVS